MVGRAMIGSVRVLWNQDVLSRQWDGDVTEARSERGSVGREGMLKQRTGEGV